MSPKLDMNGKVCAVMGLGKSGVSAAETLTRVGALVWAWDDQEAARAKGAAYGLNTVDLTEADFSKVDYLVWSPGIAHTFPEPHPIAVAAKAAGVRLICDIELLVIAQPQARFVAITGTNGKSTTTTLIGHILKSAGMNAVTGGNLGSPALSLPILDKNGIYVLELSSYQLELLDKARFDVSVLLNVSPDHLSRHGGMEGYKAAKSKIFDHLRDKSAAVIAIDDDPCRRIAEAVSARTGITLISVSASDEVRGGIYAPDGEMIDDRDGSARLVYDLKTIPTLPGRHNWQNAVAAYAACRALGVEEEAILKGLATYPGLAHRQEMIATIDGVAYVNDSKATNAGAAENAMLCYDSIYWIVGGRPKEGGIDALAPLFDRVRRAFLIGEAAKAFAGTLRGKVRFEMCGTLDVALLAARKAALSEGAPNPVVLLSPACASWDQFANFEARGESFRALVNALQGDREGV